MPGQQYQSGLPDRLPGGVSLHWCRLDDDSDMALDRAAALLSPAETARAARFHFDRHRTAFVRARGFLRSRLGAATGADPAGLDFVYGPRGKPSLPGGPEFNQSDSGAFAVLALGGSRPLGVDVERLTHDRDLPGLARRVFTEAERAVLDAAADEATFGRLFFAFWTAKEARMKLTGEGLALDPLAIRLRLDDGRPTGFESPDQPRARLLAITAPEGYACHLAIAA